MIIVFFFFTLLLPYKLLATELYIVAGAATNTRYVVASEAAYDTFSKDKEIKKVAAAPTANLHFTDQGTTELKPDMNISWTRFFGVSQKTYTQQELEEIWKEKFSKDFVPIQKGFTIGDLIDHSTTDKTKQSTNKRDLLIFVNNHGSNSTGFSLNHNSLRPSNYGKVSDKTRQSVALAMDNGVNDITVGEMTNDLNKKLSANDRVRYIGVQCYSGSLHEMTFSRKNTCGTASTSWQIVNMSSSTKGSLYAIGLTDEKKAPKCTCTGEQARTLQVLNSDNINCNNDQCKKFDLDKNGETDLIEAHLAGVYSDGLNGGRAQLSFAAFLDYKLKEGAYTERMQELERSPDKVDPSSVNCMKIDDYEILNTKIEKSFRKISENIVNQSRELGTFNIHDHLLTKAELNYLPEEIQTKYHALLKSPLLKEENDKVNKKVPKLKQELQKLQDRYRQSSNQERIDLAKKIDRIRDEIHRVKAPLAGMLSYLSSLKKVKRFIQAPNINQEEKDKLYSIMSCEIESL